MTSMAEEILTAAAAMIRQRARDRDKPDGERSMLAAVTAFNAVTGHHLDEVDGWRFMECVKMARGRAPDDFLDGSAYAALAGEAADRATWADDVRRGSEDRG